MTLHNFSDLVDQAGSLRRKATEASKSPSRDKQLQGVKDLESRLLVFVESGDFTQAMSSFPEDKRACFAYWKQVLFDNMAYTTKEIHGKESREYIAFLQKLPLFDSAFTQKLQDPEKKWLAEIGCTESSDQASQKSGDAVEFLAASYYFLAASQTAVQKSKADKTLDPGFVYYCALSAVRAFEHFKRLREGQLINIEGVYIEWLQLKLYRQLVVNMSQYAKTLAPGLSEFKGWVELFKGEAITEEQANNLSIAQDVISEGLQATLEMKKILDGMVKQGCHQPDRPNHKAYQDLLRNYLRNRVELLLQSGPYTDDVGELLELTQQGVKTFPGESVFIKLRFIVLARAYQNDPTPAHLEQVTETLVSYPLAELDKEKENILGLISTCFPADKAALLRQQVNDRLTNNAGNGRQSEEKPFAEGDGVFPSLPREAGAPDGQQAREPKVRFSLLKFCCFWKCCSSEESDSPTGTPGKTPKK